MESTTETESIDRLFLELSQFTRAKTAKEVRIEDMLRRANQVLRSAMSIASRNGECVNWEAFTKQLENVLIEQHKHFYGSCDWKKDEDE